MKEKRDLSYLFNFLVLFHIYFMIKTKRKQQSKVSIDKRKKNYPGLIALTFSTSPLSPPSPSSLSPSICIRMKTIFICSKQTPPSMQMKTNPFTIKRKRKQQSKMSIDKRKKNYPGLIALTFSTSPSSPSSPPPSCSSSPPSPSSLSPSI